MMYVQFFGPTINNYSNYVTSVIELLLVLLGQFDVEGMQQASPTFGFIFFFVYIVVMVRHQSQGHTGPAVRTVGTAGRRTAGRDATHQRTPHLRLWVMRTIVALFRLVADLATSTTLPDLAAPSS